MALPLKASEWRGDTCVCFKMEGVADTRRTVHYYKTPDDKGGGSEYNEKSVHLLAVPTHLFINYLTNHLINIYGVLTEITI